MISVVHKILNDNATLTSDVGAKVYLNEVAKGVAPPFIIFSPTEELPHNTASGASNLDEGRFSVFCYATQALDGGGKVGIEDLATNVRTALDEYSGTVLSTVVHIEYESGGSVFNDKIGDRMAIVKEQVYKIWIRR